MTLEKLERYNEAESIFHHILQIDANYIDAWYELGYCYDYLDKPEESIRCYNEHINHDPYNYNAWYNKAIVLNRQGKILKKVLFI